MLSNYRVVDCSRILVGSFASMMLAEMGAEVIKVEQKGKGDETRQWGPPFIEENMSSYYMTINKHKQSMAVDLKQEQGQRAVQDLVDKSQIFIENILPKNTSRFGLTYPKLSSTNPALIYCSISGFRGPLLNKAGFDLTVQAMSGLMSITGQPEGEPSKVGYALCDVLCAQQVVQSILAAVIHRERTGEGQLVENTLMGSTLYNMAYSSQQYLLTGQHYPRRGNQHPLIVPYSVYRCADRWLVLGVATDLQFQKLATLLDIPIGPDNVDNAARLAHRQQVDQTIQSALDQMEFTVVVSSLDELGLPYSLIYDDQQLHQSGLCHEMGLYENIGPHQYYAYPSYFSTMPTRPDHLKTNAPRLGQHTHQILSQVLEYPQEQIRSLMEGGVI